MSNLATCYGNVTQLVRADTRAVVARWDYDAYGKTTKSQAALSTADSLDRAQVNQPYRYQGHYLHAPSGLYDFGFRFYSPTLQRWMSSDPIEESGGINLHSYVGGNPTNSFDPFGLDEMLDYYTEQEAEKREEELRREQARQNNIGDTMPLWWVKPSGSGKSTSSWIKPGGTRVRPRSNPINRPAKIPQPPIRKPSIRQRVRECRGPGNPGLPHDGKYRFVPPKNYDPKNPLPRGALRNGQRGFKDRHGNEWVWDLMHNDHWDVQLKGGGYLRVTPQGRVLP